jgi:hypothetical protein
MDELEDIVEMGKNDSASIKVWKTTGGGSRNAPIFPKHPCEDESRSLCVGKIHTRDSEHPGLA